MKPANSSVNTTAFIYGTTRLGDESIAFEKRLEIAKLALDSGVWFHTSHMYGEALKVLRTAFDMDRTKVPKLIIKLGGETIDDFKADMDNNYIPLGIDKLELAQLCLGGKLAEEFANGGNCYKEFQSYKDQGIINGFVMEVFPWTSEVPYNALKNGFTEGIVDAFIFYLNPLQRFASNKLWNLINEKNENIIAMRTVSGGDVHRLRDVPGAAWKPYLQERAVDIAPIFEESGITNWTEFCVRFANSISNVKATIGSTSRPEHLKLLLDSSRNIKPLQKEIVKKIMDLQSVWSDKTDIHAEPWSM